MCIYIVKKQKFLKINKLSSRGGGRNFTEQKLGVSGVKDTAKTNKD